LTITQAATEAPFSIDTLTKSAIAITLGADAGNTIPIVVTALQTALNEHANWATAGYKFTIATGKGGENVPAVSATDMDSVEDIVVDGDAIMVVLETTSGTITSDVASVIALIEGDAGAAALVTAVANASDDQAIDDVGDWTLAGGVNGTVAAKGKILFDSGFLYIAVDACTISETNFKKVALAALSE